MLIINNIITLALEQLEEDINNNIVEITAEEVDEMYEDTFDDD